jgi:aminomethyltransferase
MGIAPGLKKTPLNDIHKQLGARMVEFAGWEMPVQYSGVIAEHMAVRMAAGLFDVSHMGRLELMGSTACQTIQRLSSNDAGGLSIGRCQYSALTTPMGTFVDDILVYRMGSNHFYLCVNASNQVKDYQWICERALRDTDVQDRSEDFALIALQGPRSSAILQQLTALRLSSLRYYWFTQGKVCEVDATVSRTGYTGEDGFEVCVAPHHARLIWQKILESGAPHGLKPAGLAARNTLRLEAKMALYGNDIDETTSLLEAGLDWICKLDKGDFIGRNAPIKQRDEGLKRILIGFEMTGRGIARDGYLIEIGGNRIGTVTSGSPAPFLEKNIGLAYVPIDHSAVGTEFDVVIRDRPVQARVVSTPFYRRTRAA